MSRRRRVTKMRGVLKAAAAVCASALTSFAQPALSPTNIFAPVSTPASPIFRLSLFVLAVTAVIFAGRLQPAGLRAS